MDHISCLGAYPGLNPLLAVPTSSMMGQRAHQMAVMAAAGKPWAGVDDGVHMALERQMARDARLAAHNARRMAHTARLGGYQPSALMGPVGYHQQFYEKQPWFEEGNLTSPKRTDPRPRLTKEEVQVLESVFAETPKPTTTKKRELADKLMLPLARINNWFQNRRAKEKAKKRAHEFQEQQERDRVTPESKSPEARQESGTMSEYYALGNRHRLAGPSSAAIGEDRDEMEHGDDDPELDEFETAHHAMEMGECISDFLSDDFEMSPGDFEGNGPALAGDEIVAPECVEDGSHDVGASVADWLSSPSTNIHPHDDYKMTLMPTCVSEAVEIQPAETSLRFKAPPPPTNIAARRKSRRPSPLGTVSAPAQQHSVEGNEASDPSHGNSAFGSNWNAVSRYEIRDHGDDQRSPFDVDSGTPKVPLQGLQSSVSPIQSSFHHSYGFPSVHSTLKPATRHGLAHNVSRTNSVGEDQGHFPGNFETASLKADQAWQDLSPRSPDVSLNQCDGSSGGLWDQLIPIVSPLPTPSLSSQGGSDVEFSAGQQLPGYAVSQPATPLHEVPMNFGPRYTLLGNGLPSSEYTFPGSFLGSSSMSPPGQHKPMHFQFAQNVTPNNYFGDS